MSKSVQVTCDHCGEREHYPFSGFIKLYKKSQWVTKNGADYCCAGCVNPSPSSVEIIGYGIAHSRGEKLDNLSTKGYGILPLNKFIGVPVELPPPELIAWGRQQIGKRLELKPSFVFGDN